MSPSHDRLFYTGMAIAIAIVVFVGFAPTYYLRPQLAVEPLPLYLHVHGLVFSAWIVLFVAQTVLVSLKRTDLHRRLGWCAAAVGLIVVVIGVATAIDFGRRSVAQGFDDAARAFMTTPILSMATFLALAGSAVLLRRRPQAHKRLMLLATINLLDAPIARWPGAPGPVGVYLLVDLFIVAGVLYDLVSRRHVDPAYLWGGVLLVGGQVLRDPIGQTVTWHWIARTIIG